MAPHYSVLWIRGLARAYAIVTHHVRVPGVKCQMTGLVTSRLRHQALFWFYESGWS